MTSPISSHVRWVKMGWEKTGNSERARKLQLPRCAVQDADTAMDRLLPACMVMIYVSISTVLSAFWLRLNFMCIDERDGNCLYCLLLLSRKPRCGAEITINSCRVCFN